MEQVLEPEVRALRACQAPHRHVGPLQQAQALLDLLQRLHPPGAVLQARDVERSWYPLLLAQRGWRGSPWGSRQGVAKYFSALPGVVKRAPYLMGDDGSRKRVRCYELPMPDREIDYAEPPKFRLAA